MEPRSSAPTGSKLDLRVAVYPPATPSTLGSHRMPGVSLAAGLNIYVSNQSTRERGTAIQMQKI
jgi:hypothetical protein